MSSRFDFESARRVIIELRHLVERQQDLIASLAAAGLNAGDAEATLKALKAQLELLEKRALSALRPN